MGKDFPRAAAFCVDGPTHWFANGAALLNIEGDTTIGHSPPRIRAHPSKGAGFVGFAHVRVQSWEPSGMV